MKHRCSSPILVVAAAVCLFAAVERVSAQSAQGPDAPGSGASLTLLAQPTYPPLAQQARIQGDVEVTVGVRRDGSVESVAIRSGHNLLAPTALESAQKSRFECRGCVEAVTSCSLVYSFRLATDEREANHVIQSENYVTVFSPEPPLAIFDDFGVRVRVRSVKCLYLWKCSNR